MVTNILESFSKNWWEILLRGILAILFGLMAFAMPGLSLVALALLYGLYALTDGVVSLMFGARSGTGWLVLTGLLGIGIGIYTMFRPVGVAFALIYLIGVWAMIRGVGEIVTAIRLRERISNEWTLILHGIVSVGFGVFLFARPGAGALALTWIIGTYALISGMLLIRLALRVRRIPEDIQRFANAA
jgi:uncharacterized membrane protein HdeD (DUF308 family)